MRGTETKITPNHGYLKSHYSLSLECTAHLVLKKIVIATVGKLPF